jgi:hypothetical protein
MPEIDDAQLAQFQNVDAFVRRALAGPKTRRKLLEIQKTLNPDTAIPELDESDPIHAKIDALATGFEQFKTELSTKESERAEQARLAEATAKWNAGQAFARKKGYADDGLKKLETFMEEHGIANHEHAIPFFEKQNPPPVPATNSGSRWDFFGQQTAEGPDLKQLFEGHEEQWLNNTVADTLNRVRNAA